MSSQGPEESTEQMEVCLTRSQPLLQGEIRRLHVQTDASLLGKLRKVGVH